MKTIKIAAVAVFALACGAFCFSKSAEMLNNPYVDMEAFADGDENPSTETPPSATTHTNDGGVWEELRTSQKKNSPVFYHCNYNNAGDCTWDRCDSTNGKISKMYEGNGGSTSFSGSVSAGGVTVGGSVTKK